MSPRRRPLALRRAALALTTGLVACSPGAVDGSYPGEVLFTVRGRLTSTSADADAPRLAIDWGSPSQPEGDVLWSPAGASELVLALVEPPPADALRDSGDGPVALGQVFAYADRDRDGRLSVGDEHLGHVRRELVAFRPAAGFAREVASAPCMVPALRLTPLPADAAPLELGLSSQHTAGARFYAASCLVDTYAPFAESDACPPLFELRFLCRALDPDAWACAACGYTLFPEGAPADVCERWRARCRERSWAPPGECDAEARACVAGEPARAAPCDLACTCAARERQCQAEHDAAFCESKNADCDWLATP